MQALTWSPLRSLLFLASVGGLVGCAPAPGTGALQQPIVGGKAATLCQWPTAIISNGYGCTGTLVNPKVVITAGHCVAESSPSTTFTFGEGERGPRSVKARCTANPNFDINSNAPGNDISVCVLDQPVTDVPIVPVLMGCEVDKALQKGSMATLVGYGATGPSQQGFGTKRLVNVPIVSVNHTYGEVTMGNPQVGACNGDSGGPAYVKLADGTWRVFGATSRGTGAACASGSVYTLISDYMKWIEKTISIDITPCFDADGTWNPGPDCKGFPMNPEQGGGSWDKGCAENAMLSGPSTTCGPNGGGSSDGGAGDGGMSGDDGGSSNDDGGTVPPESDGGSNGSPDMATGGTDSGTGGSGGNGGTKDPGGHWEGGCSFAGDASTSTGALFLFGLAFVLLARRRRSS